MKNENDKEKKGLFGGLFKTANPKKNSCCCFEIEEIPEDEENKEKKSDKDNTKPCCN